MPLFKRKLKKKNPALKNIGEGLRVNKKRRCKNFATFGANKKFAPLGAQNTKRCETLNI